MDFEMLASDARSRNCSDIHISEDMPVFYRVLGKLVDTGYFLSGAEMRGLIDSMINEQQKNQLKAGVDLDFAVQTANGFRHRVNVFFQQGKMAATIRLLNDFIPTLDQLALPPILKELTRLPRGLVLVTGPTGSGKSTTLAAMVDEINRTRPDHIITIEDPIEYVFTNKKALVHQREVGRDTSSFAAALRSALREDPDVILVGEMRDYETISAAVTAAETGHLVLSTLHTTGAAKTIDRIIDACPPQAQTQVRIQLAGMLGAVVTQCLIPKRDNSGRIAATEILVGTEAATNLIRENKCYQLASVMQSGMAYGMHTLNRDLAGLVGKGIISVEDAQKYSNDKKELEQYI